MNTDGLTRLQALLETPPHIFDIAVPTPTREELGLLHTWLVDVLRFNASDVAQLVLHDPREDKQIDLALAWTQYVAMAVREFLQLGQLPLFTAIRIRDIQQNATSTTEFVATIEIPGIDHIGPAVFRYVLSFTMETCAWLSRTTLNDMHKAPLFEQIFTRLQKRLKSQVYSGKSTMHVLRAAHQAGIPFCHLGLGVYQLGWGSKARRMDRSIGDRDSLLGARLSQNKMATASLLRTAGLPSPKHVVVANEADAIAAAITLGYPIVVKPSDRDRGEGITVDVHDAVSLKSAYARAREAANNKQVIIERQVDGICHRIFIANGTMLYALKRGPMSITADGNQTISALVNTEMLKQQQLPPWHRSELQALDDLALAQLQRAGWTADSIPAAGTHVALRRIESSAWGGVDEDVADQIHPENVKIAIRAAALFGLDIAGIDIITPDIAIPWFDNQAIINEVNLSPLFGGGDISRRHIPIFLKQYMDGDGQIPVELLQGAQAFEQALVRHQALSSQGIRCYLTSATMTLDANQVEVRMPLTCVEDRIKACLCRPDVDALVIVV